MNSLSYHESHSHGSLGLPFQAYSQEDPYGQYFVPYHWHEEVEFIYVTKGSLVLRTQNRTQEFLGTKLDTCCYHFTMPI